MAEASLSDGDINSESQSWRRTHFIDTGSLGAFPGGVESAALVLIRLLSTDEYHTWPSVTLEQGRCYDPAHGDAIIDIGDLAQFKMDGYESDGGMELDAKMFRVGSVAHSWDFNNGAAGSHTQSLSLRPRLSTGL